MLFPTRTTKWTIVLSSIVLVSALIHTINASMHGAPSPYKMPPPPPPPPADIKTVTALKMDVEAVIENFPAPPKMKPKDPYEGGSRIELDVPKEEPPPPPPKKPKKPKYPPPMMMPKYPPPPPPPMMYDMPMYDPPMYDPPPMYPPPPKYPKPCDAPKYKPPPPPPPKYEPPPPPPKYEPPKMDPPKYEPPKMESYPSYSVKPEGYGPEYKPASFYKLPSSDVPYFETASKHGYSSSNSKESYAHSEDEDGHTEYSKTSEQHSNSDPYYPHEEVSYLPSKSGGNPVVHRVIYLPLGADESNYIPKDNYHEEHSSESGPSSSTSPIRHEITQVVHSGSNSDRSGRTYKNVEVSEHSKGGTVVNIPMAAAASAGITTRVRRARRDINSVSLTTAKLIPESGEPIELTKIIKIKPPVYKDLPPKKSNSIQHSGYKQTGKMDQNNFRMMPVIPFMAVSKDAVFKEPMSPVSFFSNGDVQYLLIPTEILLEAIQKYEQWSLPE